MTDTEAKALAKRASIGLMPYEAGVLANYIEAIEARGGRIVWGDDQ